MKKVLSSSLAAYRQYKAAKAGTKAYRIARYLVVAATVAWLRAAASPSPLERWYIDCPSGSAPSALMCRKRGTPSSAHAAAIKDFSYQQSSVVCVQ